LALKATTVLQYMRFKAPRIEHLQNVPSRIQIHYYLPKQREFAENPAVILCAALGIATTADNAILFFSAKQLPRENHRGLVAEIRPIISQ